MVRDLFQHWDVKLTQYVFSRALAQLEGIILQRVLWPQFLRDLFDALQPHSQGLSSSHPLEWGRRDPGWVWSCVSQKIIIPREELFVFWSFLSNSFCRLQIKSYSMHLLRKSATMFLSCLQFAICKSSYSNVNLKVKQLKCFEAIYFGRDVVADLPTGYGKPLIFQLLPSLLHAKITSCYNFQTPSPGCPIIIVVSPLNAFIKDQMRRSTEGNTSGAFLSVRKKKTQAIWSWLWMMPLTCR